MFAQKTDLYRYYDKDDKLLYVGISVSAMVRMSQHKCASPWYDQAVKVTIEKFESRQEALWSECNAIKIEKPIYNVMHNSVNENNDNSFNLSITDKHSSEDRVRLTRRLVYYKPVYTMKEASEIIFGSSSSGPKKLKEIINQQKLSAILTKEYEKKNRLGFSYLYQEYIITGWQLIDFIECLESGEVSL